VAVKLALLGAVVGVVGRDSTRGAQTLHTLNAASAADAGKHALFVGDLSRQADVRRVAAEIAARFPEVHLLVRPGCPPRSPPRLTPC